MAPGDPIALHVVCKDKGWVLDWTARAIEQGVRYACTRSTEGKSGAVNLYINYYEMDDVPGLIVPWLTHWALDADDPTFDRRKRWLRAVERADLCLVQSARGAEHCLDKPWAVWHGAPQHFTTRKATRVGVASNTRRRKRLDVLEAVRAAPGIELVSTNGTTPAADMPAWFAGLDYYLVTSDSEGGPIPVLEAIAAGVPVIAPDVGFCWEYPVIRYSGIDELRRTLEWLGAKRDPARAAVRRLENLIVSWLASKGMTWREAKAV